MSTPQTHQTDLLPADLTWAVEKLAETQHRGAPDPVSVLEVLAAAQRPVTRREICQALDVSATALARWMPLLEQHGYVISSRRFGVSLGVRFLDSRPELSAGLRNTVLALARPHLELLDGAHEGTAFIAFAADDAVLVADSSGPTPLFQVERACEGLIRHVLGVSVDPSPALPLRGVWAMTTGVETVAVAARVKLTGSIACLGINVPTPSIAAFSDLSLSVVRSANVLTSALRRVYPMTPNNALRSETRSHA
jgi:DNA-binding transcriptional ArsR family regulator